MGTTIQVTKCFHHLEKMSFFDFQGTCNDLSNEELNIMQADHNKFNIRLYKVKKKKNITQIFAITVMS